MIMYIFRNDITQHHHHPHKAPPISHVHAYQQSSVQDGTFLQCFFAHLQSCNVVPLDIGQLHLTTTRINGCGHKRHNGICALLLSWSFSFFLPFSSSLSSLSFLTLTLSLPLTLLLMLSMMLFLTQPLTLPMTLPLTQSLTLLLRKGTAVSFIQILTHTYPGSTTSCPKSLVNLTNCSKSLWLTVGWVCSRDFRKSLKLICGSSSLSLVHPFMSSPWRLDLATRRIQIVNYYHRI